MKRIIYTFVFALCTLVAFAQAPLAPDFTVTDTHGNQHSLYADYLDQNKVVVLDLFFVDCPPCQDLAPYMQAYWEELQTANAPVQMLSLTSQPGDDNAKVLGFEEQFGLTFPAASAEGGSVEAQEPYTSGDWGEFFGYPTLVVISPTGVVRFDPWGANQEETISLLDGYVQEAISEITSNVVDLDNLVDMEIFPIPATENITVDLTSFNQTVTVDIFNTVGELVQTISTTNQKEVIPTTQLSAGNYFLVAKDGVQNARQQFSVVK